jgi:hypothetical protein
MGLPVSGEKEILKPLKNCCWGQRETRGGSEDGSYSTTLTKRFTSEYQWSKLLKREMEEINQKKIIPI